MAKFYGKVGYAESHETAPGVWTENMTEREYFGDVLEISRRWQDGARLNDDLTINNEISIVSDPFAYENFHSIRYVNWMGSNWEVVKVKVLRPRLILSLGGVYNK